MVSGVVTPATKRAIDLIEAFRREIDPEIQSQTVLTFLYVMDTPGISMGELERRLNVSQASVSRNVAALSEWHRLNRPGAGLIEKREDRANPRQKRVYLTKEGQDFARKLIDIVATCAPAGSGADGAAAFPAGTFPRENRARRGRAILSP